jgi:AbiV family abortive infection protein
MKLSNETEAYKKASGLAFDNAERWLKVAKAAYAMGYYGQARSLAITAYEEIGKAVVSWWAAEEIVPIDDDLVIDAYSYHWTKTGISLILHSVIRLPVELAFGFIQEEDILKEIVTTNEEKETEALYEFAELLVELENKRREGMYVDIWKEEDGTLSITAPSDIEENRPRTAISEIEGVLQFAKSLFDYLDENPEAKKAYKEAVEKERKLQEND